jgi:hypothetical protein
VLVLTDSILDLIESHMLPSEVKWMIYSGERAEQSEKKKQTTSEARVKPMMTMMRRRESKKERKQQRKVVFASPSAPRPLHRL